MAILDWFKEIPLSAILKEKLTSLENENAALKAENATQKILLEQCQEQRRALEEQVFDKGKKEFEEACNLVHSLEPTLGF